MNIVGRSDISRSGEWGDYDFGFHTCDASSNSSEEIHFNQKNKSKEQLKNLSNKIDEIFSDKIIGNISCKNRILLIETIYRIQFTSQENFFERKDLTDYDKFFRHQSNKLFQIREYLKERIGYEVNSVEQIIEAIIIGEYNKT